MIKFVTGPLPGVSNQGPTINEVIMFCQEQKIVAIDTETTWDLNIHSSTLLSIQIGNEEVQYVIDCRNVDYSKLQMIIESPSIIKILHNVKFDAQVFKKLGWELRNVYDTMLGEIVSVGGVDKIAPLYGNIHRIIPNLRLVA